MVAGWSEHENKALITLYLESLARSLAGEDVHVPTLIRRGAEAVPTRTGKSVGMKISNISYVLASMGHPTLPRSGYLSGAQHSLWDLLAKALESASWVGAAVERAVDDPPQVQPIAWRKVAVPDAPSPVPVAPLRGRVGAQRDWERESRRQRDVGAAGEECVVRIHGAELVAAGRPDLAARVTRVGGIRDGLGYDVLGFTPDGRELFIEVKTTVLDEHTPFFASAAEVRVSAELGDQYRLYRICNWGHDSVDYYVLSGPLESTCELEATQFRLRPRSS